MRRVLFQVLRNMGMRYAVYRLRHELEKKTGILKKRHPVAPARWNYISFNEWQNMAAPFVIDCRETLTFDQKTSVTLRQQTKRMLSGEVCFFSAQWKRLEPDDDWVTNPDSGFRYDIAKHWSEIPDFSIKTGDIKYVWEKSRFSWLLTLIRNDYHNDVDSSGFIFSGIESWIDANPVNQGPNWRCSQEISLRIFNWCYALHFYKNAPALTEERWQKIHHVIFWSLHHVYHHIDFSRIAVRNNHAITETLFLALSEILFPFIPETRKWAKEGRKWFEEEIAYQIYSDGTFLQFSMNYHRVVVQLLALGISLSEKAGKPFSESVYDKAYKSVDFLYQCLQEENGFLPNCGANDGAWFFPLSDTDYRDFRPQLNTLHCLLTGRHLFAEPASREDAFWMGVEQGALKNARPVLYQNQGIRSFPTGGYYTIRDGDTFTFIRCSRYKDRPSHADNLHVDIWRNGENVLCDGGSYKYNTDKNIVRYFTGTQSHNTVMLDDCDQMKKGLRFIWLYWSQALSACLEKHDDAYVFEGRVRCFSWVDSRIVHTRKIRKQKNKPEWTIVDEISHKPEKMYLRQLWHTNGEIDFFSQNKPAVLHTGWQSLYYGRKEETRQIEFSTKNNRVEVKISLP